MLITLLAGQAAAKRVALVIGNANYQFVPALEAPPRDVKLLDETLRKIGFDEVILHENLNGESMRRVLHDFSDRATDAEVALIYFSGHGVELARRNFLVPVDAKLKRAKDADFEAVELQHFRNAVEGASKLRMVILDACRNNPFQLEAKDGSRAARSRGLAEVQPGVNELIAFSAQAGVVADDSAADGISPFARSFTKWIAEPGMDIRFVMGNVRDDVLKNTGTTDEREGPQIPYVESSLGGSQIVLNSSAPSPPPQPPAADRGAEAKVAFDAAGEDINMLKTVASEFSDTTWGKLAAGRVKTQEEKKVAVEVAPPIPPKVNSKDANVIRLKADGSGDFTSLAVAVAMAKTGSRIELEPGVYQGPLTIVEPIEIVGTGGMRAAVIEAAHRNVVLWKSKGGLLENLTIRQTGSRESGIDYSAILFEDSKGVVRNSTITSSAGAAVQVVGSIAEPDILQNTISGTGFSALILTDKAKGHVEQNDIFGGDFACVYIAFAADPVLIKNSVHDCKGVGVVVNASGFGKLEGNEIFKNAHSGIEVEAGGSLKAINNKIYGGQQSGVRIHSLGMGHFENNDVFDNAFSGVSVTEGGKMTAINNRIKNNGFQGIWLGPNGGGVFIGNDLRGNKRGAFVAEKEAGKTVKKGNIEK